jgi:hypothetical protein
MRFTGVGSAMPHWQNEVASAANAVRGACVARALPDHQSRTSQLPPFRRRMKSLAAKHAQFVNVLKNRDCASLALVTSRPGHALLLTVTRKSRD